PAFVRVLPSAGALQAKMSEMFPAADFSKAQYVRIGTPNVPVASSALIRHYVAPVEAAVVNGVNADGPREMNFPHIVSGSLTGANYTTVIGVVNPLNSEQTVTITFNSNESSPIAVTRVIAGNGALRETAQSLFGLPAEFQTGWVRVSGTASISGFAAYG